MRTVESKLCAYDASDPLNGIIQYFRTKTGTKDPYQKGLIDIEASGNEANKSNIFVDESDWYTGYWIVSGLNNWILVDFKLNKVSLSHYMIRAWGHDYFSSWKVLGSNDKQTWRTIHDGKMSTRPESVLMDKIFRTDDMYPVRYVKFTNPVCRFNGDNVFVIHRLELFGVFLSYKGCAFITQRRRCNEPRSLLSFLLFLVFS